MRIRFIRDHKLYRKGRTYGMNKLMALAYIKRGLAIADKMMDTGVTK